MDIPVELTGSFPVDGRGKTWGEALQDSLARGLQGLGGRDRVKTANGVGVVELQAGGWSFTARDMDGGVWVWGGLFCL